MDEVFTSSPGAYGVSLQRAKEISEMAQNIGDDTDPKYKRAGEIVGNFFNWARGTAEYGDIGWKAPWRGLVNFSTSVTSTSAGAGAFAQGSGDYVFGKESGWERFKHLGSAAWNSIKAVANLGMDLVGGASAPPGMIQKTDTEPYRFNTEGDNLLTLGKRLAQGGLESLKTVANWAVDNSEADMIAAGVPVAAAKEAAASPPPFQLDPEFIKAQLHSNIQGSINTMNDVMEKTAVQKPDIDGNFMDRLRDDFWSEIGYILTEDLPSGLGSTVGFYGPALATRALAIGGTKAASWAARNSLKLAGKALSKEARTAIGKSAFYEALRTSAKIAASNTPELLALHVMTGAESSMEAAEAYNTYMASEVPTRMKQNIVNGMSDEDALNKAIKDSDKDGNRIAAGVYADNYGMLLISNKIELSSILGLKGGKLGRILRKSGPALLATSVSESFEEGYQYGVQKYEASKDTMTDNFGEAAGMAYKTMFKGLIEGDEEAWTSMILGGLSGVIADGAGRARTNMQTKSDLKKIKKLDSYQKYVDFRDKYEVDSDGKLTLKEEVIANTAAEMGNKLRALAVAKDAENTGNWAAKSLIEKELLADVVFDYMSTAGNPKGVWLKTKEFFTNREQRLSAALGKDSEAKAYYDEYGNEIDFDGYMRIMEKDVMAMANNYSKIENLAKKAKAPVTLFQRAYSYLNKYEQHKAMAETLQTKIATFDEENPMDAAEKKNTEADLKQIQTVLAFYHGKLTEALKPAVSKKKTETEVPTKEEPVSTAAVATSKATGVPIKKSPVLSTKEEAAIRDQKIQEDVEQVETAEQAQQLLESVPEADRQAYVDALNDKLTGQRADADLTAPVDATNAATLRDSLDQRYTSNRKLLHSKDKTDLRGKLMGHRTYKKIQKNREQLEALEKERKDTGTLSAESQKALQSFPKYIQEIITNDSLNVSIGDITALTNQGVAYLFDSTPSLKKAIAAFYMADQVDFEKTPEQDQQEADEEADTIEKNQATREQKEKEESDESDSEEIPGTKQIKLSKVNNGRPRKATGVVNTIFRIFTRAKTAILNRIDGHLEPIPYQDAKGQITHLYLNSEEEAQQAAKLLSSGNLVAGSQIYFEVDPNTPFFQLVSNYDQDDMSIQTVAYVKDGKPVAKGTEGSTRVPFGTLKAANNGVYDEQQLINLNAIRKAAFDQLTGANEPYEVGATTLSHAEYQINVGRTPSVLTGEQIAELVKGKKYDIVYRIKGAYVTFRKSGKPSLDGKYWKRFADGKPKVMTKGGITSYQLDEEALGIGLSDVPHGGRTRQAQIATAAPYIIVQHEDGSVTPVKLALSKVDQSPAVKARVMDILDSLTPDNYLEVMNQLDGIVDMKSLAPIQYDPIEGFFRVQVAQADDTTVTFGGKHFKTFISGSEYYELSGLKDRLVKMPDIQELKRDLAGGMKSLLGKGMLSSYVNFEHPFATTSEMEFEMPQVAEATPETSKPQSPKTMRTLVKEFISRIMNTSQLLRLNKDESAYVFSSRLDEQGNPVEYDRVSHRVNGQYEYENGRPSEVGNRVDELVRDFFDPTTREPLYSAVSDIMSEDAFNQILTALRHLDKILVGGRYTVLSNRIMVHDEEARVAGELDLLLVDNDTSELLIYDIKTFRNVRHDESLGLSQTLAAKGKEADRIRNKVMAVIGRDRLDKWVKQQNAYRIMLENTYGTRVRSIAILPIGVNYDLDESEPLHIASALPYKPFELPTVDRVESVQEGKPDIVLRDTEPAAPEVTPPVTTKKYSRKVLGNVMKKLMAIKADSLPKTAQLREVIDGLNIQLGESVPLSSLEVELPGVAQEVKEKIGSDIMVRVTPTGTTHYSPLDNTIYLSEESLESAYAHPDFNGMSPQDFIAYVIAHELGHSYTAARLHLYDAVAPVGLLDRYGFTKQEVDAIKKVKALFQYLKSLELPGYGFKSEHEMLAEVNRNPAFSELLDKITLPDNFGTKKTFLGYLKELFNKIMSKLIPGKTAREYLTELDEFFAKRINKELLERDRQAILDAGDLILQLPLSGLNVQDVGLLYNRYAMDLFLKDMAVSNPEVKTQGLLALLKNGMPLSQVYDVLDDYVQELRDMYKDILGTKLTDAERIRVQGYVDNLDYLLSYGPGYREALLNDLERRQGVSVRGDARVAFLESENTEMEQEAREEEDVKENWQKDFGETDPLSTASGRVRFFLRNLPVALNYVQNEDGRWEADGYAKGVYGTPQYHDEAALFYTLVDLLSLADTQAEIVPILEEHSGVFPWINELLNEIQDHPEMIDDLWVSNANWIKIPYSKVIKSNGVFKRILTLTNNKFGEVLDTLKSRFYTSPMYTGILSSKKAVPTTEQITTTLEKALGFDLRSIVTDKVGDKEKMPVYLLNGNWVYNPDANPKAFYRILAEDILKDRRGADTIVARVRNLIGDSADKARLMHAYSLIYANYATVNPNAEFANATAAADTLDTFLISRNHTLITERVDVFLSDLRKLNIKYQQNRLTPADLADVVKAYDTVGITIPLDQLITLYYAGGYLNGRKINAKDAIGRFVNATDVSPINRIAAALKAGEDPFQSNKSSRSINAMARLIASVTYSNKSNTFLNLEGNRRFLYARPNEITKLFNRTLAQGKKREQFVADRKRYVFHNKAPIYDQLLSDNFRLRLVIKEGVQYSKSQKVAYGRYDEYESWVIPIVDFLTSRTETSGLFEMPPMSDSSTHYGVEAPVMTIDQVVDLLPRVLKQEISRIKAGSPGGIEHYDTRHKLFHFFNLNTEDGYVKWIQDVLDRTEPLDADKKAQNTQFIKNKLRDQVEMGFEIYLNTLERLGLITRGETLAVVINESLIPKVHLGGRTAYEVLREYYYNQFYYNTQMLTLLGVDPAFNKSEADVVKRVKGEHTPGPYAGHNLDSKTFVAQEETRPSSAELKKLSEVNKGKAFDTNEMTDGASMVTVDFQIKKLRAFNEITPEQERVYRKFLNGEQLTEDEHLVSFGTNKPHIQGKIELPISDELSLLVPLQIKNSEYVLTPNLAYQLDSGGYKRPNGKNWDGYTNPGLAKWLYGMETQEMDRIVFPSNLKTGNFFAAGSQEDLLGGNVESSVFIVPGEAYKRAQVNTEKAIDKRIAIGSQAFRHLLSHLKLNKLYKIPVRENSGVLRDRFGVKYDPKGTLSLTGAEIYQLHHRTFGDRAAEGSSRIAKKMNVGYLTQRAASKAVSPMVADNINYAYNPAYALPVESLYMAQFRKVLRPKVVGSSLVNQPSIGLSEDLKTFQDPKTGALVFEMAMPVWTKLFFKAQGLGTESSRKVIFYRIPTEEWYSIMPGVVTQFLPTSSGSILMLPKEYGTITGGDMDNDKMYSILKKMTLNWKPEAIEAMIDTSSRNTITERLPSRSERRKALLDYLNGKFGVDEYDEGDPIRAFLEQVERDIANDQYDEFIDEYAVEQQPYADSFDGNINLLIDVYHAIAGDPEVLQMQLQGAEYQELIDMMAPSTNALAIAHPAKMAELTHDNVSGSRFIGVFANTLAAHQMMVNSGVDVQVPNAPRLGNTKYELLGQYSSAEEGVPISKNLARGVEGSVENSKLSIWARLGVDDKSVGVTTYLLSLGIPWSSIHQFINLPIIRNAILAANKLSKQEDMSFDSAFNLVVGLSGEEEVSFDLSNPQNDASALKAFAVWRKDSSDFVVLTQLLKPDKGDFGKGVAGAVSRLINLNRFGVGAKLTVGELLPKITVEDNDDGTYNYKLDTPSKVPSLNSFYQVVMDAVNSSHDFFPYTLTNTTDMLFHLVGETDAKMITDDDVRILTNAMGNAVLQNNYVFESREERDDFLVKFPHVFMSALVHNDQYRKLAEFFTVSEEGDLEMVNAINIDDYTMLELRNAVGELPSNLVDALTKYVIHKTGLSFGAKSLSFMIPGYKLEQLKRTVREIHVEDVPEIARLVLAANYEDLRFVPFAGKYHILSQLGKKPTIIAVRSNSRYLRAAGGLFEKLEGDIYTRVTPQTQYAYYESPEIDTLISESGRRAVDAIEVAESGAPVIDAVREFLGEDVENLDTWVKKLTGKSLEEIVEENGSFEASVGYIMKKFCK